MRLFITSKCSPIFCRVTIHLMFQYFLVNIVHTCARLHQHACHRLVPVDDCKNEWCLPLCILCIDICTCIYKQLCDIIVILTCRPQKRGHTTNAFIWTCVYISICLYEQPSYIGITVYCRKHERSNADIRFSINIRLFRLKRIQNVCIPRLY